MNHQVNSNASVSSRRVRLGVAMAVTALHIIAAAVLIRAFAPDWIAAAVPPTTAAFDIPLVPPAPAPAPRSSSTPTAKASQAGRPAPAGKKAVPRAVTAPALQPRPSPASAPTIAATGAASAAGAVEAGQGTGAGGIGTGLGAGSAGSGPGGGGAQKVAKIAGDIVSARDYPAAGRTLRRGSSVTVAVSVDAEGQVTGCRVVRPSRDPEADRITCRLATERFRFRPARDAFGRPVASVYGWQQRWFEPGGA